MKTILKCLLAFLLFTSVTHAQFDDQFYFPSKKLHPHENINYESVTIKVDNDTLQSVFLKPTGKPKATLLFFQGNGGNYTDYLYITNPLVKAGYQVFMTSFRGYGKSTGKPTHLNISSDSKVIFEYLTSRNDVKNTKIIIYGASIGCQVATNLTRTYQSKIEALILDSGFASFTDIALSSRPKEQHDIIKQFVTSPYSAKEDILYINNVKKLIIQSRLDKTAPYEQGESLFTTAKIPKNFYEYQGGHIEAMKVNPEKLIGAINELLL
jgi:pimeloyl-ACP methyl ester carboxylesterase